MRYHLKTDPIHLPNELTSWHWCRFSMIQANSPEEAELKFKKHLGKLLRIGSRGAARRIAAKDFEVEETDIPVGE